MRRAFAICMLLTLIVSNTEFHQLVKVPYLFAHFSEHKSENAYLSFTDFILEHYRGHDNKQTNHEHGKLPFKSHECQHYAQVLIAELHHANHDVQVQIPVKRMPLLNETVYMTDIHSFIWQPPQSV